MNPGIPQRIRRGWIRLRIFETSRPQLAQAAVIIILVLAMLCGFALAASTWGSMDYAGASGLPFSVAQTVPMRQA
jgi:hypothetical protein